MGILCFTEAEAFVILWALGQAREAAVANDALSDATFLDQQYELVRARIDRDLGR
jgi:hypothetical protein